MGLVLTREKGQNPKVLRTSYVHALRLTKSCATGCVKFVPGVPNLALPGSFLIMFCRPFCAALYFVYIYFK